MGSFCSRRQATNHQEIAAEEWILIPANQNGPGLQKTIRKVIRILRIRRIWAKLGRWLAVKSNQKSPLRNSLKEVWAQLGQRVVRRQ